MRYRNDVIRSVLLLLLLQIRANFGMMLARDYASCHVARSTLTSNAGSKQRAKTQMDLNLPTYCKVRAQSLQLNLRELTRVIHQICAAIPQQYIHIPI